MTIIATDGYSVAADGLSSIVTGEITSLDAVKIKAVGDAVYALAGVPVMDAVLNWVIDGAKKDDAPVCDDWSLMKVEWGRVQIMHQSRPIWSDLMIPTAMGSGELVAIGAMCAGKTPLEAVKIACQRFTNCGGKLLSIDVPRALAEAAE